MNRQTKRLLKKQEAAAEKERARATARTPGRAAAGARAAAAPPGEREGRIKRLRRFLKEVRFELKKVQWPTRGEVFTYTIVVLVSVTVVTLYVFGLDFAFANGVLRFFR